MTTWLYQISPKDWSPERYRFEIWEGERWCWYVGSKVTEGNIPQAGDIVAFFYAPTGGIDPGFYGWAVVLEWFPDSNTPLTFRPTAPSDHLKMHPWWDAKAQKLAKTIRGRFAQRTLWIVHENLIDDLRNGITGWVSSSHSRQGRSKK